jgi:hypothetical protein
MTPADGLNPIRSLVERRGELKLSPGAPPTSIQVGWAAVAP